MDLVPGSAGEVRNLDRSVAVLDGDSTQFRETAPFGHVIDIHVKRKAVPQTVDQTVVHDEVHTSVASDLLCKSLKLRSKDRIAVVLKNCLEPVSRIGDLAAKVLVVSGSLGQGVVPQTELLDRILACIALAAHNLVHAVVRARRHHVVFHEDGLAFLRRDHRHREIGVLKVLTFLSGSGFHMLRAVHSLGLHRDKGLETVAAMDVHHLADRTEAVGRIDIPLDLLVEIKPPVVPIGVPERIQIVMIGTLSMENLSEQALLSHRKDGHLIEIIAAVLKHHAMLTGLLGHVDQSPDVLQRSRGRNLHRDILAMLHRIERDRNVMLPVSADVDKVDVVTLAEFLVGLSGSGITGSLRQPPVLQGLLCGLNPVGLDITKGVDLHARNVGVTLHGA